MHHILPKDGMLILTTPYHGYFKNIVSALLGRMDSRHGALWGGGHIKFWSRKTLLQLLERNGFRVAHFEGEEEFPFCGKVCCL